jgi:hypothetical protein
VPFFGSRAFYARVQRPEFAMATIPEHSRGIQKVLTRLGKNQQFSDIVLMFHAVFDRIGSTNLNHQSEIEGVRQDIAARYAKLTSELTLMLNTIQESVVEDQQKNSKSTMTSIIDNRLKVHRLVMDACATVTALDAQCQHLGDQVADLQATFNRLFGEDTPNWTVDDVYKSLHSFKDAAVEFRHLWKAMTELSKNYDSFASTMECITKEPGGKDCGESRVQRPDFADSRKDIVTRIKNARERARRTRAHHDGTVYYINGACFSDSEFSEFSS